MRDNFLAHRKIKDHELEDKNIDYKHTVSHLDQFYNKTISLIKIVHKSCDQHVNIESINNEIRDWENTHEILPH